MIKLFIAMFGIAIGATIATFVTPLQERPASTMQIWEVKTVNFSGSRWNVDRSVTVYKFQVGNQVVCKAIRDYGTVATPMGDVPCEN